MNRMTRIFKGYWLGACCVCATPNQYLLFAKLFCRFGFVQPLYVTVVPFVEAPALGDWNMHGIHRVQDYPHGSDGPLEHRGKCHIKVQALLQEQTPCIFSLLATLFGQVYI